MSDIKSALTERGIVSEYGSRWLWIQDGKLEYDNSDGEYGCIPVDPLLVARLCLYNQPFGFTQEDASLLRAAALFSQYPDFRHVKPDPCPLLSLAERIEALLPPSSP